MSSRTLHKVSSTICGFTNLLVKNQELKVAMMILYCLIIEISIIPLQVVCERYNIKVDGLSSLIDGEALCCLIYYYSDVNFHGGFSSKVKKIKMCSSSSIYESFILFNFY